MNGETRLETRIYPVDVSNIGRVTAVSAGNDILDGFDLSLEHDTTDAANLRLAAEQLRTSDVPVAFPTETVYGLGADATRSDAVRGIFHAKRRPADNPLIVHFASLRQLRELLQPNQRGNGLATTPNATTERSRDPIPEIYRPVISKFWPGPLTIILPNPPDSPLAPEVTAGLETFGARMPRHFLSLALIKMADRPIAAPSANASTKPSPTAAEHVAFDLDGEIETILDGGPCDVGVESTVVDGLSDPPLVLRPGGVSLEQLRSCPGWERTQIGYKNVAEAGEKPKAPGMKYRHYAPRAAVVLSEWNEGMPSLYQMESYIGDSKKLGIITTKLWRVEVSSPPALIYRRAEGCSNGTYTPRNDKSGFAGMLEALRSASDPRAGLIRHTIQHKDRLVQVLEINLGSGAAGIARGIFSALRELDREGTDIILVEGIDELEGDAAAAIMNRLRKAAESKSAD